MSNTSTSINPYAPLLTDKIAPGDIDANKHFYDTFGDCETEVSAGWIVRLCQEHGSWRGFTFEEIQAFYGRKWPERFWFNRLIDGKWIVADGDSYYVTDEFIWRCHRASPMREGANK